MTPGEVAAEGKCHWWEDAHNYEDCAWETSCGEMFLFTSDGPKENRMGYCCYCGGRLVADAAAPDEECDRARAYTARVTGTEGLT